MRAFFGPGASTGHAGPSVPDREGPRTAVRVAGGRPRHLSAHLDRLQAAAEALSEPAPWIAGLEGDLGAWVSAAATADGALRLALHGAEARVAALLEPLPVTPEPYRLASLLHPMGDLRSHPLARHKGLSGAWRPSALAEARARGADDALLLWPDGTLAETAIAAFALEVGTTLILPPPEGRVASLAEALDLPAWAAARGLTLRWESLRLDQAATGPLWCLNAVRGIWPAILLP